MFEKFNSNEGLFFYLGQIVNISEDPDVVFKYVEAACKCHQYTEAERVTRENDIYDAVKVKDFLKEMKLKDPRPLINVCDKHDFVEELTQFLHATT
jgi:clathrin heavy chain